MRVQSLINTLSIPTRPSIRWTKMIITVFIDTLQRTFFTFLQGHFISPNRDNQDLHRERISLQSKHKTPEAHFNVLEQTTSPWICTSERFSFRLMNCHVSVSSNVSPRG